MAKEKDFIFKCRKCGHNCYVERARIQEMINYDCLACGEEGEELWILIGRGNFNQ